MLFFFFFFIDFFCIQAPHQPCYLLQPKLHYLHHSETSKFINLSNQYRHLELIHYSGLQSWIAIAYQRDVPLPYVPGTSFYSTWPSLSAREEATTTKWRTYLTSTTSRSQTTQPLTEKARRSVTPKKLFNSLVLLVFLWRNMLHVHTGISALCASVCFYLPFEVRTNKLHHCVEMSLCEMSVCCKFYCLNINWTPNKSNPERRLSRAFSFLNALSLTNVQGSYFDPAQLIQCAAFHLVGMFAGSGVGGFVEM